LHPFEVELSQLFGLQTEEQKIGGDPANYVTCMAKITTMNTK